MAEILDALGERLTITNAILGAVVRVQGEHTEMLRSIVRMLSERAEGDAPSLLEEALERLIAIAQDNSLVLARIEAMLVEAKAAADAGRW